MSIESSVGMQGQYNTPEKHKEAMLGFIKGWNAPHVKKLIAETPADKILLSNIYERYVQVDFQTRSQPEPASPHLFTVWWF